MDQKLLDAYGDYLDSPERRYVLDDSLLVATEQGKTVEEHIVEVLRAADMLPAEYRDAAAPRRSAKRALSARRSLVVTCARVSGGAGPTRLG